MTTKPKYYNIDCGFFPSTIKLCFSDKDFQKILKDYNVPFRATALDIGVAETHMISDGRQAIIILAFDLNECATNPSYLAGTIAHEATHCAQRVFDHIGEDPDQIGEETRAYLTEHIVSQITEVAYMELVKHARKTGRNLFDKSSEVKKGNESKIPVNNNGGAGQDSPAEQKTLFRRIENGKGRRVRAPKNSFSTTGGTRVSGINSKEQK